MSSDLTVQELLERNKQYSANPTPLPLLTEISSTGLKTPSIVILTCADPRCVPEQFLGLRPIEAVVFRNLCGHAAPIMDGLLALDHFLGFTDIMVIHHTDCGALAFTDEQVREDLRKRQPNEKSIDTTDFGTITDLEQSVKDDLAVIKGSPLMRKELAERSYGFIYDIKTGLVSPLKNQAGKHILDANDRD